MNELIRLVHISRRWYELLLTSPAVWEGRVFHSFPPHPSPASALCASPPFPPPALSLLSVAQRLHLQREASSFTLTALARCPLLCRFILRGDRSQPFHQPTNDPANSPSTLDLSSLHHLRHLELWEGTVTKEAFALPAPSPHSGP